ncbi:hypothetical protein AB0D27_07765 [Streptomyces sp. NPDC048415]|uniref:SCO2400 family protein n=1 Tax=Streptomyces sp. NPDC048415 TaxID=3154822 RepID=UPI003419E6A3
MDYCSSCRRHLNGALACAGCGAYAPDIAPTTADGRIVPARAAMTTGTAVNAAVAWEFTGSDTWHDGGLRDGAAVKAGLDEAPRTDPYGDLEGPPPAPQGRAARRRQLARWKKNQRRAVVATAVALVGGGLTVAAMDRQSTDRVQAATAPEVAGMGTAEEQAAEQPRPSSTRPETLVSSHTPPAQSSATSSPRRQTAAAAPRTTPTSARPYAAASPQPAATSAPQPRTANPSSVGTVPDPTTAAAKETSAAADGTASRTSQPSPAATPASTSPPQICLLVVCLG